MGNTVLAAPPPAARYGRQPGLDGSAKARDEWWAGGERNDTDQNAVAGASQYANQQAVTNRGPMAQEDPRLTKNEASGANGHQGNAVGLAGSLARGNAPSAAAYQLQAGLDQGLAQQTSMGRSARGSGAIATAGANAGYNMAAQQQNAFTQGGLLRSRDMAEGRGLLGSALEQQRRQDTSRIGLGNEMSQFNADQNDKYRLGMGQAGVQLGQAGAAQGAQDLSWYQGGMGAVDAQSEADQAARGWWYDQQNQVRAANKEDEA